MEPELIADYECVVGEGPMWHPLEKRLYWLDILTGRIFWFDPATGEHEQCYDGEVIGGFTIQEDGALLLFMARGRIAVLRGGELHPLIDEIPQERENRFNDVIADPAGRVFCGTMPMDGDRVDERLGRLYRLDTDGSITPILEGIGVSNGMGFTPDRKGMYYTDSIDCEISLFDYDEAAGSLSNRRAFVETPVDKGLPDGMTVDAEGHVWSARAGNGSLHRYTPDGVEERVVHFPARLVSSVTMGGADLTDIYVTTIGGDNKAVDGPGAGGLFRVNFGIRGVPEFLSRISF
jgi:D-xylonolactonase